MGKWRGSGEGKGGMRMRSSSWVVIVKICEGEVELHRGG